MASTKSVDNTPLKVWLYSPLNHAKGIYPMVIHFESERPSIAVKFSRIMMLIERMRELIKDMQ